MAKFRKKPVVIEAMQLNSTTSMKEIIAWGAQHGVSLQGDSEIRNCSAANPDGFDYPCIRIPTLEGTMTASVGDWVICGVKKEFYPCKPDIFEATYESAEG